MPAIYHEGSWLGNATDPEVLVKDTVGWTGKNRAYSQTNNAVIAHIESDITYDVSWTGSATITLKKNSASGATITSGSTSPLRFTTDADYELYFGSSANVTEIMVKDSRITDPTYEPYHESVQNQLNAQGVLGAKNLLPNNATSQTVNGVTFTVNADGSVTANGTATAETGFNINRNLATILEVGKSYILSGCTGGSANTYYLQYLTWNGPYSRSNYDGDTNIVAQNSGDYVSVRILVRSGATINNVTFKPMIRLASDPDDTYVPYAPTNAKLNEEKMSYADNGVLGAKNLLPNNAISQTINGVTFTVNNDGSITANGTASATAFLPIVANNTMTIEKGSYILSAGDGIVGNYSKYGLYINNAPGDIANTRTEERTHFTLSADTLFAECKIFVTSGTTVSNLIFKPMIRLASDPDDTYQPYAMTNRELTEEKINIADLKTVVSASSDFADFKTRIASL